MNDNDVDGRLSEYGARWRATQPAPPEPAITIAPPWRRWAPALATAAAVALIAAGVTVGVHASRHHASETAGTDGVVPWVDRPAAKPPPPTQPSPPPPAYAECKSDQLAAHVGESGAATGNEATDLVFLNVSDRPCTLTGYASSFTGIKSDGSRQLLHPQHGTFFDSAVEWPANLQPGEHGLMIIGTASGCIGSPGYTSDPYAGEIIELADGGKFTLDAKFDTVCGLDISQFHKNPPQSFYDGPTSPYDSLEVTADFPSTAVAGTTLHYTVRLRNTGNSPVTLEPCPTYEEALYGDSAHDYFYELNCDTVTSIQSGESVTYAMEMSVPDSTGPAKFAWRIAGSSAGTGGLITIIPAS